VRELDGRLDGRGENGAEVEDGGGHCRIGVGFRSTKGGKCVSRLFPRPVNF
jgi:hypothetical protein